MTQLRTLDFASDLLLKFRQLLPVSCWQLLILIARKKQFENLDIYICDISSRQSQTSDQFEEQIINAFHILNIASPKLAFRAQKYIRYIASANISNNNFLYYSLSRLLLVNFRKCSSNNDSSINQLIYIMADAVTLAYLRKRQINPKLFKYKIEKLLCRQRNLIASRLK